MYGKNRFLACLCCLCCCLAIVCMVMAATPAFAVDVTTQDTSEPISSMQPSGSEATEPFSSMQPSGSEATEPFSSMQPSGSEATEPYIVSQEVTRSVSPVTPSDANGFKAVLLGLFGDYETVVTEHRYTSSNGYTSVQVTTEPDYAWMISAAIFIVVLYCLFRLLGGVLCGRK